MESSYAPILARTVGQMLSNPKIGEAPNYIIVGWAFLRRKRSRSCQSRKPSQIERDSMVLGCLSAIRRRADRVWRFAPLRSGLSTEPRLRFHLPSSIFHLRLLRLTWLKAMQPQKQFCSSVADCQSRNAGLFRLTVSRSHGAHALMFTRIAP